MIALDGDVDHRKIANGLGYGIDKEGGKGDPFPVLRLVGLFISLSPKHNIGHVCLHKGSDMG